VTSSLGVGQGANIWSL